MRRLLLGLLCSLGASALLAQELMPRVRQLLAEGKPDLALAELERHDQQLQRLDPAERFLAARLSTNGEHFDRLAGELANGMDPEQELTQRILFERAREQFARGQYLAALEVLRGMPLSAQTRLPEFLIFRAMAAQAVGEQRAARQDLESVPRQDDSYAMARMLLADLLLRSREARGALDAAEAALDADDDLLAPQALFLKAQALEQLARPEDARDIKREILRRYPRSAEAAGLRGSTATAAPAEVREIAEEALPERREQFSLQLGAFRDRALALRQAERLRDRLEDLRIEYDLESSPAWYRVVVGRFPSRSAAEEMQRKLAGEGIESALLIPGRRAP